MSNFSGSYQDRADAAGFLIEKRDREAVEALTEAARAMRLAFKARAWWKVDGGFGTDPYADNRDAEFHLRALYRILGSNVEVLP